ncbi:uncharacterized protein MYCFIDRAFT_206398 [Pseudocercospora fijiensis CIRAD86]|uniref:Uncharacterized protein n=1 Tax=Pseudocercospora fijiensis (strain CIRAD86) TaxID=383855 RepID=N1QBP5_PSEFD|nr:uncharacterized protein MYCFIDRAFT_206398 [Pseudocercospora fijiensis CIRAD86]EME89591.1 hypothetical protein MYCFIDRAFT_206398 [Pseudocercospora fijiensis CIRAD86]
MSTGSEGTVHLHFQEWLMPHSIAYASLPISFLPRSGIMGASSRIDAIDRKVAERSQLCDMIARSLIYSSMAGMAAPSTTGAVSG